MDTVLENTLKKYDANYSVGSDGVADIEFPFAPFKDAIVIATDIPTEELSRWIDYYKSEGAFSLEWSVYWDGFVSDTQGCYSAIDIIEQVVEFKKLLSDQANYLTMVLNDYVSQIENAA